MNELTQTLHRVSTRPAAAPTTGPTHRRSPLAKTVLVFSLLNLTACLVLTVLFCIVSEQWWLSLALSYLPRAPYVFPSLLLIAASLLVRRRLVWLNLVAALLIAGPVMGFRAPLASLVSSSDRPLVTVTSYNIQGGGSSPEVILSELAAANPDVIVLQEATGGLEPITRHFADWTFVRAGEYLVGSRWPVTPKDVCRAEAFGRATAVLYEIDHPEGAFLVCNVHLTTARYGLAQLRPDSLISGRGVDTLMARQELREMETFETRQFVAELGFETPVLVVGDFNVPTSSSLFQKYWSGMTSAFDAGGWGYGYTSPCDTDNLWPANTPWLRIDHILLDQHWNVHECSIGRAAGSDHRCITARISRR